jgi:hypothetical protein
MNPRPPSVSSGAVAHVLGWTGTVVSAVEYAGQEVDVVVRFNDSELSRRDCSEAVLDRALLRALMELPLGIEVPCASLRAEHLVALQLGGDDLVEWTQLGIRRTFQPACEVIGIMATSHDLGEALRDVSALSGFALRAVWGPRRSCGRLLNRATQLGVGLVASGEGDPIVVATPERRGIRPSPSRWRFSELAYERWARNLTEPAAMH